MKLNVLFNSAKSCLLLSWFLTTGIIHAQASDFHSNVDTTAKWIPSKAALNAHKKTSLRNVATSLNPELSLQDCINIPYDEQFGLLAPQSTEELLVSNFIQGKNIFESSFFAQPVMKAPEINLQKEGAKEHQFLNRFSEIFDFYSGYRPDPKYIFANQQAKPRMYSFKQSLQDLSRVNLTPLFVQASNSLYHSAFINLCVHFQ
jgi:hypothetical protein